MEFKDYYKILGVETDADDKAIKSAYRKLARKYHPDVSDQKDAEARFKEVTEAYEVLKDTQKRAEYDELRAYGQHGQPFTPPPGWQGSQQSSQFNSADFSDFFSSIFGGGFEQGDFREQHFQHRARPQRGQDIETDLPIFLEDTLSTESKTISYHLGGKEKTLNVKIPAGVNDGERIRLKGQGGPGQDGQPNGDLYLRIRLVPHPLFDVEGHNLFITVPLAPWEAALGTSIAVPTLSGKIQLKIPAHCQSGQRLRIKGKGLIKRDGHGDLYAVLNVVMPDKHDAASDALWQQLADSATFDPRKEWRKS